MTIRLKATEGPGAHWTHVFVLAGLTAASALSGCAILRYGAHAVMPGRPPAEFVLETPPVDLPLGGVKENAPRSIVTTVAIPVDGWLHGFSVDVVDSAGRAVPTQVVHHVSLRDPKKRDLFAPVMLRVIGAGHETESVQLPTLVGYPLFRRDSLLLMAMLHNPTKQAYSGVRVRVRIAYTNQGRPNVVYPFAIHVTDPAGPSEFDLPPGRSEQSWTVRPAVPGHVFGFGGHLHRYGIALRFEDLTAGKVLYQSKAQSDRAGNVIRVPRRVFYLSGGIRIRPDHEYRVTAVYSNPTGATMPGAAMGTVAGLFRPDGTTWPASNPSHPIYIADLQRQLGQTGTSGHAHQH